MTTKLDRPLKRELEIGDSTYTLTLTPAGLKLTQKGRRKGFEVEWRAILAAESTLATASSTSSGPSDSAAEKDSAGEKDEEDEEADSSGSADSSG